MFQRSSTLTEKIAHQAEIFGLKNLLILIPAALSLRDGSGSRLHPKRAPVEWIKKWRKILFAQSIQPD